MKLFVQTEEGVFLIHEGKPDEVLTYKTVLQRMNRVKRIIISNGNPYKV